ncbi:MAG TPA: hypothetical protein DDW22_03805 [Prevotellaceae bacterium]|nr:hypothetical protein [Prevotellaceae bacterium]
MVFSSLIFSAGTSSPVHLLLLAMVRPRITTAVSTRSPCTRGSALRILAMPFLTRSSSFSCLSP